MPDVFGTKNIPVNFSEEGRLEYITRLESVGYRRTVSQGAHSTVLRSPDNSHVIKVGLVQYNHGYLHYLDAVVDKQHNPWFPNVLLAGIITDNHDGLNEESYFYIAMERLNHCPAHVFDNFDVIIDMPGVMIRAHDAGMIIVEKNLHEAMTLLEGLITEYDSYYLDLHMYNVMMRGQHPVIIDPLCS